MRVLSQVFFLTVFFVITCRSSGYCDAEAQVSFSEIGYGPLDVISQTDAESCRSLCIMVEKCICYVFVDDSRKACFINLRTTCTLGVGTSASIVGAKCKRYSQTAVVPKMGVQSLMCAATAAGRDYCNVLRSDGTFVFCGIHLPSSAIPQVTVNNVPRTYTVVAKAFADLDVCGTVNQGVFEAGGALGIGVEVGYMIQTCYDLYAPCGKKCSEIDLTTEFADPTALRIFVLTIPPSASCGFLGSSTIYYCRICFSKGQSRQLSVAQPTVSISILKCSQVLKHCKVAASNPKFNADFGVNLNIEFTPVFAAPNNTLVSFDWNIFLDLCAEFGVALPGFQWGATICTTCVPFLGGLGNVQVAKGNIKLPPINESFNCPPTAHKNSGFCGAAVPKTVRVAIGIVACVLMLTV